ncbi:MAG: hypothetical protein NTZ64_12420 [Polaromonas sp.]|nr:hypothetical protein [Polaromonas sp.]
MKPAAFAFVALLLHSGQSVASEGLVDAGLSVCLPLQAAEEWVLRCNSEFPEFSQISMNEFSLWKERNSAKFEESHRECIARLGNTLPKENQVSISEMLKIGLTKRTNEQWEKLSRNALMTYCKNMPTALKERERILNEFLANTVKREVQTMPNPSVERDAPKTVRPSP